MDFLHVMTIRLNIAEQIPNTSEAKKIVFAFRPPSSLNLKPLPRIARQSQCHNARGEHVKKLTQVLMYDIGGIVQQPVNYFKSHVLPEIHNVDLFQQSKSLADALRLKGVIVGGRWKVFEEDPLVTKGHEDTVYSSHRRVKNSTRS